MRPLFVLICIRLGNYPSANGFGFFPGVALSGNLAYATTTSGIIALDMTDPANFRPVGEYATARSLNDLQVVGERIYAAAPWFGLMILEHETPPLKFMDSGTVLPDQSIQLRWSGGSGSATLQTSSDLREWTPLTTQTSVNGLSMFIYEAAAPAPMRAYRLLGPPPAP